MNPITQCPECNTRFNISQEQLEAYHGMVRCGRCQAVFNAIENLYSDEPSPQLDLPIMLDEALPEEPATAIETPEPEPEAATPADETLSEPSATTDEAEAEPQELAEAEPLEPTESASQELDETEQQEPAESESQGLDETEQQEPTESEPVETQAADQDEFLAASIKKKRPAWPWAVAASFLLLLLLAQAAYFFRVELAAHLPGLKPALVSYCGLLDCQVALPRDVDRMSIDSSDLEADPNHANVITLTATLRNHAPYAQAYPDLELTLNDANDKPVARRTLHPAEYLGKNGDEKAGLGGRREFDVKLNLDTSDLKPSGYRLLLFYPQ